MLRQPRTYSSLQGVFLRYTLLVVAPTCALVSLLVFFWGYTYFQQERKSSHQHYHALAATALKTIDEDLVRLSMDLHRFVFDRIDQGDVTSRPIENIRIHIEAFWESRRSRFPDLDIVYYDSEDIPVKRWGNVFSYLATQKQARPSAEERHYLQEIAYKTRPISYFECEVVCYYNVLVLANRYSKRFGKIKLRLPVDKIFHSLHDTYDISYALALPQKSDGESLKVRIDGETYVLFPVLDLGTFAEFYKKHPLTSLTPQLFTSQEKRYALTAHYYKANTDSTTPYYILALENVTRRYEYFERAAIATVAQMLLILAVLVIGIYMLTRRQIRHLSFIADNLRLVGLGQYQAARGKMHAYGTISKTKELRTIDRVTKKMVGQLERLEQANQLQHQNLLRITEEDDLTGLFNRRAMERLLAERQQQDVHFSLFLIDINYFKAINDTYGHEAGDRILVEVARILKRIVADQGVVGRSGGDEFFALIDRMDGKSESTVLPIAESMLEDCRAILTQPETISGMQIKLEVTLSIGICHYPEQTSELRRLLTNADLAMYENKRNRTGSYRVFTGSEQMLETLVRNQYWETQLKTAIRNKRLEMHIQAIVRSDNQEIIGYEGLARVCSADNEFLPAESFIDAITQTGAIEVLDSAMLDIGLSQAGKLAPDQLLFINLSTKTIEQFNFVQEVVKALTCHRVPGERIVFEISEKSVLTDEARAIEVMQTLSRHGIQFALDDFGKGYTSVLMIHKLPIRYLKLDRSFTYKLEAPSKIQHTIEAVVKICRAHDIAVIAEGIEHESQLTALARLGVDYVQGYYIDRPQQFRKVTPFTLRRKYTNERLSSKHA